MSRDLDIKNDEWSFTLCEIPSIVCVEFELAKDDYSQDLIHLCFVGPTSIITGTFRY